MCRHGHSGSEPQCAVRLRRPCQHRQLRLPGERRRAARDGGIRRAFPYGNPHRQELRRPGGGRRLPADGHRSTSQRPRRPALGPQAPRAAHRDVRRRAAKADKGGSHRRLAQEDRHRQGGGLVPARLPGGIFVHRQEPLRADEGHKIHQRPLDDIPQSQHEGNQLRDRGRPHGADKRRFYRLAHIQRHGRAARFRKGCVHVRGRQEHHGVRLPHEQGAEQDSGHAETRGGSRHPEGGRALDSDRIRSRRPLRQEPAGEGEAAYRHSPPR